jgi:hypothetical protein
VNVESGSLCLSVALNRTFPTFFFKRSVDFPSFFFKIVFNFPIFSFLFELIRLSNFTIHQNFRQTYS